MSGGMIVVIGNLITVGFSDDAGAAVKIDGIRAIFVDNLKHLVSPGGVEFVIWITVWQIAVCLKRECRTVVNLVLRIVYISLIIGGHKPAPQPLMMEGGNQLNVTFAKGFRTFAKDIAMGSTVDTVDGIYIAVPHGKIVGMLGDRTSIAGTAFYNQISPFLRIK